jgi:signal transduction histidine kinase
VSHAAIQAGFWRATQKLAGVTGPNTAGVLVAAVAGAALVALLGVMVDSGIMAFGALGAAIVAAAVLSISLLRLQEREAERARLSEQLITAEQDERRRLALFLHDVPVQAMSGIALMLDGVVDAIERGATEDAKRILNLALDRQRETIRGLRDLSFALEPVVLRDQGFAPAVQALADQVETSHRVRVELDIGAGDALADRAQVVLYQIIRESLDSAIRRGPPTRVSVTIREANGGGVETVITDDGSGERRRRTFEALEERARTLQGNVDVDTRPDGTGTAVRVTLPPYTAQR